MEINREAVYLSVVVVLVVATVWTVLRRGSTRRAEPKHESESTWATALFVAGTKLLGLIFVGAALALLCMVIGSGSLREFDSFALVLIWPGLSMAVFGLLS